MWLLAAALAMFGMVASVQIVRIGLARGALEQGEIVRAFALREENPHAAALVAAERLVARQPEAARQAALAGLRASPFTVEAVRALGQARNRLVPGSGNELMLLAGQLGWRDVPTQVWLIQQAVLTQSPEVAVQRTEALVRLNFRSEGTMALLRQLSAEPRARAAIVRSLADRPAWRARFVGSPSVPRGQWPLMAAILTGLARSPAPPTRIEANPTVEALAAFRSYAEAYDLHRRLFGNTDLGIAGSAEGASIFDWRLHRIDGAEASMGRAPDKGGLVLLAETSGAASGPILARTFVLAPGSYELHYRMRSSFADAAEAFPLIAFCAGGSALATAAGSPLPAGSWQARALSFSLHADCPAVHVQLLAAPSPDGRAREAELDGLKLVPLKR